MKPVDAFIRRNGSKCWEWAASPETCHDDYVHAEEEDSQVRLRIFMSWKFSTVYEIRHCRIIDSLRELKVW
jgi:hypothetical protein